MTTNMNDRFEDRLLAQLQDVVAANPTPAATPATTRSRAPRIALATAGTAAAAVAVVLVATGGGDGSTAKAYDVSTGDGDAVLVTIRSLDDAAGLQRSLNDAGVPAVVCTSTTASKPAHAKPLADPAAGAHRTGGAEAGLDGAGESGSAKKGATTSGGDRPSPVAVNAMPLSVHTKADGSLTFTVHRGDLPSGEHLHITTQGDPDVGPVSIGFGVGVGCDG